NHRLAGNASARASSRTGLSRRLGAYWRWVCGLARACAFRFHHRYRRGCRGAQCARTAAQDSRQARDSGWSTKWRTNALRPGQAARREPPSTADTRGAVRAADWRRAHAITLEAAAYAETQPLPASESRLLVTLQVI